MKKIALIAIIALGFISTNSFAQKFGYLNLGNLVVQMPDTEQADNSLKTYQEGLIKKGEEMAKAFETSYALFAKKYQEGGMTPKEAKDAETKLGKERESITKYEKEVYQKIGVKRQELMAPILKKIEIAVNAVGDENNYTFIFDASMSNTILFAQDSDNIETLVKAKLGL
ncbi:MAG: outer membrane protein [Paraglaciecola sp.]|jgi:outer membrane protein